MKMLANMNNWIFGDFYELITIKLNSHTSRDSLVDRAK